MSQRSLASFGKNATSYALIYDDGMSRLTDYKLRQTDGATGAADIPFGFKVNLCVTAVAMIILCGTTCAMNVIMNFRSINEWKA